MEITHTSEQWRKKAWLRPKIVEKNELIFHILGPKDESIDKAVYAVYHGRFIESMLRHCDELFSDSWASAVPEDGDIVT